MSIRDRLFALQDPQYREFSSKLIPTVDPDRVIGVRTPALRALAKELSGLEEAEDFLHSLPHAYYEEDNLHAFLLEKRKNYPQLIEELERFLPYVDNWATCDSLSPAIFKQHPPQLREQCRIWLTSEHTYVVRFAMGMLMKHFLDDHFSPEYPAWIAAVSSDEYYIRMMQAWYFATALAKHYDEILPWLQERKLDPWIHNKTIQKAVESFRVSPEQKLFLRTLKVK